MKNELNHERLSKSNRSTWAATLGLGAILFSAGAVASQSDGNVDVEATRQALEEWTETKQIISKERNDWMLGREILQNQIELTERQIEAAREKISDAEGRIGEADTKLSKLEEEEADLAATSAVVGDLLSGLEGRVSALLKKLPPSTGSIIDTLSQRLPQNEEQAAKQSLSDRFLTITGILNDLNKFQREVKLVTEIRKLADGSEVEVGTLYLGLGQAFYANEAGTVGGVGSATEEGWTWTPLDAEAEKIAQLLRIAGGEDPAAFVQLPIRVE